MDAKIAATIRGRRGVWSLRAIRDLADRILFRHDPAAIRERRERALGERAVWVDEEGEGMAIVSASMSAENARLAVGRVRALAKTACRHDRRGVRARNSDAAFALLSGTAFECTCGRDECDAQIPPAGMLPPEAASIVIHVVCDATTLSDPTETTPAVLDGYGVISADHVRELADRPDAVVHHPNLGHQTRNGDSANDSGRATPAGTTNNGATTRGSGSTHDAGSAHNRGLGNDDCGAMNQGGSVSGDDSVNGGGRAAFVADTTRGEADGESTLANLADLGTPADATGTSAATTSSESSDTAARGDTDRARSEVDSRDSADARSNSAAAEPETRRSAMFAPPPTEPEPTRPPSGAEPCPKPGGLAPHLASDPYRPSAALNLYLQARDMTCAVPGCTRAAFDCDLDHVREYDHADPMRGGLTHPAGMNAKCRFHHLLKTFGDFVDDQILVDGRPQTTFITPEGLVLPGRADSGLDILPALATIGFRPPDTTRTIRDADDPPRRPKPRTAQRHARREQERRRNRERNTAGPPPPF